MIRKRVAPCDRKLALNCGCRHVSRSVNIRFQLIESFQANVYLTNLVSFFIFVPYFYHIYKRKWKKMFGGEMEENCDLVPSLLSYYIGYQSNIHEFRHRRNFKNGDGSGSNFPATDKLCCAEYRDSHSHGPCIAYNCKSHSAWSGKRSLYRRSFPATCLTNVRKSWSENVYGEPRWI